MSELPEEVAEKAESVDAEGPFSFASDDQPLPAVDLNLQADEALLIQDISIAPAKMSLSGRTVLDIVVPEDRPQLRKVAEKVLADGGIERLRVRIDMGDSPYAMLGVAKLTGECPLGISALFLSNDDYLFGPDVDEAALYRELFERLPISVYFKGADTALLRANTNMVRSLGFTHPRDVLGMSDDEIAAHHDNNVSAEPEHTDQFVLDTGVPVVGVTQVETYEDGSSKVVHVSRFPIRNRDGQIVGTMGFSHDVTQSTRVVEALARSEQRYALAAKASRDGIWDYSIENDVFEFSPRMRELLGLPVTADTMSGNDVFETAPHNERAKIWNACLSLIEQTTEYFEELIGLELENGEKRWLEIVGTALVVDGEVVRLVGSAADVTDDREREARLSYMARHDPLTSLANRRLILEKVNEALENKSPAVLLSLDLDDFKVINDSLGHQAGDEVLHEVARRLSEVAGPDHLLGRLGGDEFALLVTGDDVERGEELAESMLNHVRKEVQVSGLDLYTTVSIGLVTLDDTYFDANQVFRDADIALYEAKKNGRARWEVFHKGLRSAADDELDRQVVVRRAVQKNAFFLVYQPIFDSRTRQVTGVEALLRLTQENGLVETPAAFLPYLEQTELILEVGEWVIDESLKTLAMWRAESLVGDEFRMALNVSRKQFTGDRLAETILAAVKRHGLAGSNVVIEVTETAVADGDSTIVPTLERLRENDIKVALDDFGTGQSSLAVLHDLPVDILKIDKSFTNRIDSDNEEPVTRAALWLAKSMGLVTVAEGVENESQHEWLIKQGCDMVQGYLLARPVRSDDLAPLLRDVPEVSELELDEKSEPADLWDFGDEEAREAAWKALHDRPSDLKMLADFRGGLAAVAKRKRAESDSVDK